MSNTISAYGTWTVTTEGDCEGRTTKQLGTHTGYIDEIAFALGSQCYYSLHFKQIKPEELIKKPLTPVRSVDVQLDIDTGTWNMDSIDRAAYFRQMLSKAGRSTSVKTTGSYAAVTLLRKLTPQEEEAERMEFVAKQALEKLSADEIAALKATLTKES